MQASDEILRVRDLRKTYRASLFGKAGVAAIDGVTLEVGRGTVFGLLGPNGAGKTTLIKVLLGLVRDYQGEASIFGLRAGDPRSRKRTGYLPEAHRLPGHLTGREVLRLFGALAGAAPSEVEKRVGPLLERVGMTQAADRKVREYSKGMQQRVGLAQALVNEPEIVFLDEPTDGVDPVGRAAIRELVLEQKRKGVTLFINSHLLHEVELVCDRVVMMDRGKIVLSGTIDELTSTAAVRFELGEERADVAALLGDLGPRVRPEKRGFELDVRSEAEIDAAIDRLRAARVSIRAIHPRKQSLEEVFIRRVRKERA